MGINLDNYEHYFLDHLEGNLSPETEKELAAFLRSHPELKQVLEDFDAVTIPADDNIIYHPKNSLKKNIHSSASIDARKLEEMMVSSVEGLLSEEEEAGLQAYLNMNPSNAWKMDAFRKTRIPVDLTITYPNKSRLKRKAGIAFIPRLAWGITAAAALIIILLGIRYFNRIEESPVFIPEKAVTDIISTPSIEPQKELPYAETTVLATLRNEEVIGIGQQERFASFRINETHDTPSSLISKKYAIHRLKKRPVVKLQTVVASEPSLFAQLTDKVINKAGRDIRDNIPMEEIRKPKLNFWAFLSGGIKGYNKITDREIELFVYKNDEGKVSSYALVEHDRLILNRELNIE